MENSPIINFLLILFKIRRSHNTIILISLLALDNEFQASRVCYKLFPTFSKELTWLADAKFPVLKLSSDPSQIAANIIWTIWGWCNKILRKHLEMKTATLSSSSSQASTKKRSTPTTRRELGVHSQKIIWQYSPNAIVHFKHQMTAEYNCQP